MFVDTQKFYKHYIFAVLAVLLLLLTLIVTLFLKIRRSDIQQRVEVISDLDAVDTANARNEIKVDISGAVTRPGVYALNRGERIVDLINLAEGFTDEAYVDWIAKNLNLSIVLADAAKVYIPFIWDMPEYDVNTINELSVSNTVIQETTNTPLLPSSDKNLINVNSASKNELDSLPGIGEVYAQKLIEGRPYIDFHDLLSKSGISSKILDRIKNQLAF